MPIEQYKIDLYNICICLLRNHYYYSSIFYYEYYIMKNYSVPQQSLFTLTNVSFQPYLETISHINNHDIILGFPISYNSQYDEIIYSNNNQYLNALQLYLLLLLLLLYL